MGSDDFLGLGLIVLAFILGIAAAIILSKLGAENISVQTTIFGIHFQADGSAAAFALVYLGALRYLPNLLSRRPAQDPSTRQLAVRVTRQGDWPPDPRSDRESK